MRRSWNFRSPFFERRVFFLPDADIAFADLTAVSPLRAVSWVKDLCNDPVTWQAMLSMHAELAGERAWIPNQTDPEAVVLALEQAVEKGRILVAESKKRPEDEQVFARSEPALAKVAPPSNAVRPPAETKNYYEIKVIDDTGEAVSGATIKVEVETTPRMASTGGNGKVRFDWFSPGSGIVRILDTASLKKKLQPKWAEKPRLATLPTGPNVTEVEISPEFAPITIPSDCTNTIILGRTGPRRARLVGMVFDANKTFLLPHALGGIRTIVAMHAQRPKAKVLIIGHAEGDEALGGPDLATARAQAVSAYLTNQPAAWVENFGPGKPARSRWGTREVQLMLSALDPPLYEGTASGITDKKTELSLKAFQRSKGLSVDGKATSGTLRALLESYMALQDTSLAADITPVVHGCQGHFDDSQTSAGLEPDDRRLEVFFFPDEIYPAPPGGVSGPGSAAYPAWQKSLVETQDFEVHGIHVQIVDSKKQPVPFADAILEGPTSGAARADRHGFVSFFDLVAGAYTLRATKAGTKIGTYKITYPTAKTEPGKTRAGKSRAKSGVPL